MSARVGGAARERQIAIAGLLLGPTLLAVGLAVGMNPNLGEGVLPIEPAWIQGAIALPMLLMAPGVLSLAWTDWALARTGKWISGPASVGLAMAVVGSNARIGGQIGCQPITDPMQVVPVASALGLIVGAGFFIAVAVGAWYAGSERPRAAIVAAAGVEALSLVADFVAFMALFQPGVSCARGPV